MVEESYDANTLHVGTTEERSTSLRRGPWDMASRKARKCEARLPGLAEMATQGSLARTAWPCRPRVLAVVDGTQDIVTACVKRIALFLKGYNHGECS